MKHTAKGKIKMQLSPMMQQYIKTKEEYQDCILFYRLGDFYEMFFDDATLVSKELGLALTGRSCGLEERAPMCGVPFHSSERYIAQLVEKGYKVAICEQVEDPKSAKGLVKREVVQIITPGTIINDELISASENNYLAAIYVGKENIGISFCDISTGEITATSLEDTNGQLALTNELVRFAPKEIIINKSADLYIDISDIRNSTDALITEKPDDGYNMSTSEKVILKQFEIHSLVSIGIEENQPLVYAIGSQLLYLLETQKQALSNVTALNIYHVGDTMALDRATIKNLEITETLYEKRKRGSLLGILDKTHTAMGARKMKKWLKSPLNNLEKINDRLDAVSYLVDEFIVRNNIKEHLKQVYDFERLIGKIAYGTANAKDMLALKSSLFVLPELIFELEDADAALLKYVLENIDPLTDIYNLIDEAIEDEPSDSVKEGGIIKGGYSAELDELKFSISDAKAWMASFESRERKRTGIQNLKVGFNRTFGYYIDVTKSNYDKVPDNYIVKQTLSNSERYYTTELKETEATLLSAETKINQKEYEIFLQIRDAIKKEVKRIQKTSKAIAILDVITSFAEVSSNLGYVRPVMHEGDEIVIKGGKHPVVENAIGGGRFVSNDLDINCSDKSMLLITGPNMAGKSTYMRQNALIVLMAQAGCFVPCEEAKIGVVDRIFTRIGASDNLAGGQSTFYVEMSELAYILNNATKKSLIILDEIGRGTSTYDGLSIAWAAIEYLCSKERQIKTLFASHYHELTALEDSIKGFKNLNVDVAEENGQVVFLHKILDGSASRSYGIHVAKLAGVPNEVLENAENKLKQLEKGEI